MDLVPSAGSAESFEFATWNIENYPKNDSTPEVLADLIASLDVDMVALQEVEDIAAFDELVERLRGYDGVLSSHTYGNGSYQKIGYVYRTSLVSLNSPFLLFTQSGYEFPRPALKVDVTVGDGPDSLAFTSIALHLKAGEGFEDRQRREDAVVILEDYLRSTVDGGNSNMLVLGDFNSTLTSGATAFSPFTSDGQRYTIRTQGNSNNGDFSFVPTGALLDHVVTTSALESELSGSNTIIPRLDTQMTGYVGQVSDHLPVIVRVPL